MNKVIKKMWKKAEEYADINALLTDELEPMMLEHFAELIVLECAGLAEDGFDDELDGQEICDRIKQHFGVE